jgi:hypothetical protein
MNTPLKRRKSTPRLVPKGDVAAKFCKIAPEVRGQHHDALAFPDGSTVLVNSLVNGQRVRVLQLPVAECELQSKKVKELPPVPEARSV